MASTEQKMSLTLLTAMVVGGMVGAGIFSLRAPLQALPDRLAQSALSFAMLSITRTGLKGPRMGGKENQPLREIQRDVEHHAEKKV
jgi:hypothetical protein